MTRGIGGAAVLGGETTGRRVGVRGALSTALGGEGKRRGRPGRCRGRAARRGHGEGRGWPEVGGEADRWGPLVGERERERGGGTGPRGPEGEAGRAGERKKGVKRGGPAVEKIRKGGRGVGRGAGLKGGREREGLVFFLFKQIFKPS
jgi:hypothetical protein